MPNVLDAAGLQTKTQAEIRAELVAGYESIYGADINVDQDTPDGQQIGIYTQADIDNLDLLVQIYNSFDPDRAVGRALDARAAINGLQRLGGTFTFTDISIVVDRSVTLTGLDGDIDNPEGQGYTVSDNAGVKWVLAATTTLATPGTYVRSFRAQNNGATLTVPNTINVPVTIVLGVTSVNNPTTYSLLGINEETDAQLRLRRQKSVSISSQGYLAGLLAQLLDINGVVDAFVYENNTGSTDGDGVPGHSIWVIMNGGADADIALAIYQKRNAGAGMKGSEVVLVDQPDGTQFEIRFDRVVAENLFIKFDATSINGIDPVDSTAIKAALVANIMPGVFETFDVNEIATAVQQIDDNVLVTGCKLSLSGGGPFFDILSPSAKNKRFALSTGNITITVI